MSERELLELRDLLERITNSPEVYNTDWREDLETLRKFFYSHGLNFSHNSFLRD